MEDEEIIEPKGDSNGKTLKIICELCQSWGMYRKVEKLYSLLINKLSQKGYTININIKGTFYGKGEYYIYLDEVNDKKAIFTNSKEMSEASNCVYGRTIDEENVDKVIEFIETKV